MNILWAVGLRRLLLDLTTQPWHCDNCWFALIWLVCPWYNLIVNPLSFSCSERCNDANGSMWRIRSLWSQEPKMAYTRNLRSEGRWPLWGLGLVSRNSQGIKSRWILLSGHFILLTNQVKTPPTSVGKATIFSVSSVLNDFPPAGLSRL